MNELASKKCIPCQGGTPPLKGEKLRAFTRLLEGNWNVVDEHDLEKEFKFNDFKSALAFTNQIGALAEEQNHHPDIFLSWGLVKVVLYTHKIDGLSESDFIFAAKIQLLEKSSPDN